MPSARPKLQMLKPRLQELAPRIPTLSGKTLKEKQQANGRTLALNGAAWRKLRATVLAEQPLCPECRDQGLLVPASEVDHQDNDPSNNSRDNLVGLCKTHHSQKTAAEMHGHKPKAKGCDVSGMPLDPNHPWNRGTVAPLMAQKSPAVDQHEPPWSSRVIAKSITP
jgi:5-methylcytosine-specific restriction protein A